MKINLVVSFDGGASTLTSFDVEVSCFEELDDIAADFGGGVVWNEIGGYEDMADDEAEASFSTREDAMDFVATLHSMGKTL